LKAIELTYKNDGVYLLVNESISKEELYQYLEKKKVKDINKEALSIAVEFLIGEERKIAEYQEEYRIDAEVDIFVSENKMQANIEVTPPDGGKELTRGYLLEKLKERGIVFGIDESIIENLCINPVYNKKIAIAQGVAPKEGKNGKLIIEDKFTQYHKTVILDDGSVDYFNLDTIKNVKENEVIAKIIPPVEGVVGRNVLGEVLKPRGVKPANVRLGKNVELNSSGEIVATSAGSFMYKNNAISISDTFEVDDVDNSTGNLNSLGSLNIRGNVSRGRIVKAAGNIHIRGFVEGAIIEAEGDIIVDGGIRGMNCGEIKCGGNLKAKFIEHANIYAGGNIESELIIHCNVKCDNSLKLIGKKGLLIGGKIKVMNKIFAKNIGSDMAVETVLELGLSPSIREEFISLSEKADKKSKEILNYKQIIDYMKKLGLNEGRKSKLEKILIEYKKALEEYKLIINKKEGINEIIEKSDKGEVYFSESIFPGTKVYISSSYMVIDKAMLTGKLSLNKHGEIALGTYK
jgi:uncharacterized protein (DUF342 family)